MKTNYTPGLYFVGTPIRNLDCVGVCKSHSDGGEIHEETIAEVLPSSKSGQQLADATLFAAAPDLVEALREMMRVYEPAGGEDPVDAVVLARAALRKAGVE